MGRIYKKYIPVFLLFFFFVCVCAWNGKTLGKGDVYQMKLVIPALDNGMFDLFFDKGRLYRIDSKDFSFVI